ncbi:MAG: amidohydrolase [Ilumatobacter sp.]|uniref:amidohydrolase family protein n=1 Tax=Ilumatobacter sp. TaxID=1967498 RepID=UPI00260E30F7|nr:amidohydrolase [Ilumatobacter sp.]MDJ0767277.1 amidohydrolase [Ilumatobacter sp.]
MTIVAPTWLVTSAGEEPRRDWGVRVAGETIDAVGPTVDLREAHPADEVVDAADHVVLPGFVNAHVHLYGVLAHGIPADAQPDGFWSFLEDYWWPQVEDRLDHEMIRVAAEWACLEMLRSGTTGFFDILEAPHAPPDALFVERTAVERFGLRGLLSFEATERAGPEVARLGLDENVRLIDDDSGAGLVQGAMSWHTVFTCTEAFIREAVDLAGERGAIYHAHCNEGTHEGEWSQLHHGMRTVEFYDSIGVAGPSFLASQCVQVSDRERELIAERGMRVSHMPLANCEVGGGIAPVPELHDAGVTIGLGSDGYINDVFEVMRGAFLLHKARLRDPGAMPAATVLGLATEGGAQALGFERVGRLEPGWAADLQVVDARFPTPAHAHNLVEQLVLWRNHTHVRDVMVAGSWRVRGGEVIGADAPRLRAALHEQAERLWAG